MKLLGAYLKSRRGVIGAFGTAGAVFMMSFGLYHLPLEAVGYPFLLCAVLGAAALAWDYSRVRARRKLIEGLNRESDLTHLPEAHSIEAADYQALAVRLGDELRAAKAEDEARYREMIDYYTVWAHQIKTPISSMRLTLRGEDSHAARILSSDLFRVEQYVDMVLAYLRLDSESSDYVFREHELDDIVRKSLRCFSAEFIARRLHLDYEETGYRVVTDEKWLGFVLEQLLSNALKYTREGGIRVFMPSPGILAIEDTGIGIAAADIPRIFEKGYTGFNGRSESHSSGIGLYLCRRVCSRLGIGISVQSEIGQGTRIELDMRQERVRAE